MIIVSNTITCRKRINKRKYCNLRARDVKEKKVSKPALKYYFSPGKINVRIKVFSRDIRRVKSQKKVEAKGRRNKIRNFQLLVFLMMNENSTKQT